MSLEWIYGDILKWKLFVQRFLDRKGWNLYFESLEVLNKIFNRNFLIFSSKIFSPQNFNIHRRN